MASDADELLQIFTAVKAHYTDRMEEKLRRSNIFSDLEYQVSFRSCNKVNATDARLIEREHTVGLAWSA